MDYPMSASSTSPPDLIASPAAAVSATPSRIQAPRACDRCKRLRRRCSRSRPCRRCIDAGLQTQCQGPWQPTSPGQGHDPTTEYQRLATLLPNHIVDHCARRFFERLYLTIPILTEPYLARLRFEAASPETGLESLCVLAAMCAQVFLQAEEPEGVVILGNVQETNSRYGRKLFDAAAAVRETPHRLPPSLEMCLSTFFLYACAARLLQHSQTFIFLRDATTMMVLLRRPPVTDEMARLVSDRLFWVTLISERSHAIRYHRHLTLSITPDTPELDSSDPTLVGFWSLAALFRPLDTSFIALHNEEIMAMPPSSSGIDRTEAAVNAALKPGVDLHDTQKVNLRVTQLWLRIIIWQLRLRLGYLVEESYQNSLLYRYPIEVAKDLVLSTRDLPLNSFTVHGVGLTEKLFDIASVLVDVVARVPLTPRAPTMMELGHLIDEDLFYIRSLMRKLPGNAIYDELLEKHIQQALPGSPQVRGVAEPVR